jgi:uncharacterized small protein (DUF1192 family)
MFHSKCVRERSNVSQDNTKYKFDKHSFDKNLLKKELPLISPKAKTLLDKIKELDDNDLQNHNKLYKHFIYCDIKSRKYGANFLASCFLSENYHLGYNNHQHILSDSELLKTKNNNFFLLSSLEVFNKPINISLKKNILSKFNQRPENIHGSLCRFIIMDNGYKEGIDLFDIKYIHIFEPSLNNADLKQVIGRGTRTCGQKGLKFIPGIGWSLYVYIYDLLIQEEVSSQFLNSDTLNELYLKTLNIDVREIYFTTNLQKLSVRCAVDYELNKKIHNFRIRDTNSEQKGGASHCSKLPQNTCNTTSGCYFIDKNRKYCRKGTRKVDKELNICSKKNKIDCTDLKDDCIFVDKYRKYCRRKTKKRENKIKTIPPSSSLTNPSSEEEVISSLTNPSSSEEEEDEIVNIKYRYIPPIHRMSYEKLEKFILKYFKHCKWENVDIENACGDDFVEDSDLLTDSISNKAFTGGSTLINYNPTQMFIGDYFKPTTFVKGMLLWHSVGTGKTCAAIIAASKNFEFKKYTILWVTRTTLKEDIWKNIFDQVCHQKLRKYILKGNKIPEDRNERFRLLSKYWNIKPISYKQFTNLINESNRFYEQLTKRNGITDPLRKTLLIIDEVHKLYGTDTLSGIERPNMIDLKNAIMKSYSLSRENSVRLLLMTATPITSNPMELIKLLNLCKLPHEQMPETFLEFSNEYLNEEGEFTHAGREKYKNEITGIISYLNREFDVRQFAQPIIENVLTEFTPSEYLERKMFDPKKINSEYKKLKKIKNDEITQLKNNPLLKLTQKHFKSVIDKCQKFNNKTKRKKYMPCKREIMEKVKELLEKLKLYKQTKIQEYEHKYKNLEKDKEKELNKTVLENEKLTIYYNILEKCKKKVNNLDELYGVQELNETIKEIQEEILLLKKEKNYTKKRENSKKIIDKINLIDDLKVRIKEIKEKYKKEVRKSAEEDKLKEKREKQQIKLINDIEDFYKEGNHIASEELKEKLNEWIQEVTEMIRMMDEE